MVNTGDNTKRLPTSRRRVLKTIGATGVLSSGLAGCLGGGGGSDVESLKVGYVTSLSGPFAVFGQAGLDGAELAARYLEEDLGVDIEIYPADAKLDPTTGLQRMKRLVLEEGVDFTMGGVSSSVCLKLGAWASDNNIIYFASGGHSDAITGTKCSKYMFRPTCSNTMLAHTVGQEMVEAADKWYLLYSNYTWGQTAQAAVSKILKENGKTVVGKSACPFPADDYAPYLNKANTSDAKGIALLIAGLDFRKAMNTLVDKGMHKNHILAMHQVEDVVLWGLDKETADELNIGGQVWGPAVDAGKQFKKDIAESSDIDPYVRHLLGFMSMDQGVRAAVRGESTDAEVMRKELEGHEVTSRSKDIKGGGKMYWRACNHQLIQPAFGVKARPVSEMQNEPYKVWLDTTKTYPGDDIARTCEESGCSL